MHAALEYPFDSEVLLKKYKSLKRELLNSSDSFLRKKIAVLGGSTTNDIRKMLELFLLGHNICPEFYESEYAQFWQDAIFGNEKLDAFAPDIIFIHTSYRNISVFPEIGESKDQINEKLANEYERFSAMWGKLFETHHCPIIQNNFEYPFYRLMGNKDADSIYGRVNYITRLNMKLYEYAQEHENFYINDINWLSADYGLEAWSNPFYWYLYKYSLCVPAIPRLSQSVANIIKSIYGKNKKAFALDLDNTLWGGVVGDDGPENLELGQETSIGEAYSEFQSYIKAHKGLGILLNIISKNDHENAIKGLNHPDSTLSPEDFIDIKANWEHKNINMAQMAEELALLPGSFVFLDDNPVERDIVKTQFPEVAVPTLEKVEQYIRAVDRSGFFEVTSLSADDLKRSAMYKENIERTKLQMAFTDYKDFLRSLDMQAEIMPFSPMYISRIAQLTNRSNQFNLTTKRYTQEEIASASKQKVTLYGKLSDKFGDNGVVSVVIGEIENNTLHIVLWLMSCRVLKRDMEFAMMDELVMECQRRDISEIIGYYYPSGKNGMVSGFYDIQGFDLEHEEELVKKVYKLRIDNGYELKNHVIAVNK